jgi:hypothetical protein
MSLTYFVTNLLKRLSGCDPRVDQPFSKVSILRLSFALKGVGQPQHKHLIDVYLGACLGVCSRAVLPVRPDADSCLGLRKENNMQQM